MIILFWVGILISIAIGLFLTIALALIWKKRKGNGSLAGILGFFLGVIIVFAAIIAPRRLYVIHGDADYSHYLVLGSPTYTNSAGENIPLDYGYNECMIVNEWERPVVIEFAVYGGYGFGGDTDWVNPNEYETMPDHRIFYFYDDEPPEEISVNDATEETTRLWLRNKRD